MPIYEYLCVTCEHTFDAIQKMSDAPLTKCPECGAQVKKCVSGPAIQFKGSGFYITDYAKKSGGNQDGGQKKSDKKKSEKKGDG